MPDLICKRLDTIALSIQQVAESVADCITQKWHFSYVASTSSFFILYSLFFILYSLFFILYSLFFILYSSTHFPGRPKIMIF